MGLITRFRDHFNGRVELLQDGDEFVPGLTAILAPGYTPGHLALRIVANDEILINIADAANSLATILHPEWHLQIDFDPAQASQTREHLLRQAAKGRALVLGYHLPWPNIGHIVTYNDQMVWQPVAWNWSAQEG